MSVLLTPPIDPNSRIDFYAGSNTAYSQLETIYKSLEENRRGVFYASPSVEGNGVQLVRVRGNKIDGINPIVISSYRDLHSIFYIAEDRPLVMLEREYIRDTRGLTKVVALYLCGNEQSYNFRRIYSKNVIQFETDQTAVSKLLEFVKGKDVETITEINGKSIGLIYMAWGQKAENAIKKSLASLRRLGYMYPYRIVGATSDYDLLHSENYIPCDVSPFDSTKGRNFQFRAGRIKPLLAELSPFDLNLYIDADAQFINPIHEGFEVLQDFDMCVTEEKLSLKDLYNKHMAGWELNLLERDATIIELGGNDKQKFINSGVIFFKRNKKTLKLFSDWHNEWMRFQEWDEQLALMRAIHSNPNIKINRLPVEWNHPQYHEDVYIYHPYGRGSIRTNVS